MPSARTCQPHHLAQRRLPAAYRALGTGGGSRQTIGCKGQDHTQGRNGASNEPASTPLKRAPPSAHRLGVGRSLRSSPRSGKPTTWRRRQRVRSDRAASALPRRRTWSPSHPAKSTSNACAKLLTHIADHTVIRGSWSTLRSSETLVSSGWSMTSTIPTRPTGAYPTNWMPARLPTGCPNAKSSAPNVTRTLSASKLGPPLRGRSHRALV